MALSTAAMIGLAAAAGGAKTLADNSIAAGERKRQAQIAKWSPWSGVMPDFRAGQDKSILGGAITGGATGAVLGSALSPKAADTSLLSSSVPELSAGAAPVSMSTAPSLGVAGAAPDVGGAQLGLLDRAAPQSPYSLMGGQSLNQAAGSAGALGGAQMSPWMMNEFLKQRNPLGTQSPFGAQNPFGAPGA